ncbi:hypothetical protein SOVF_164610 [Spinacia oleracea]|nr:hypothetical protein SOVF_164610 [Spinacia oleracea]
MGSSDNVKSPKSEKTSPPATEHNGVHMYPDWAAMQAYYGPRVALPPYFNSAVAPGHPPPPYMWGPPQPMVPPYGAPYAAIYAPGGVYAHPAIPLASQAHGQEVAPPAVSEPLVATPLSMDTPAKSPKNADKGFIKKLKGFNGLAMSIGNGNTEKTEGDVENRLSQSAESEGSSNGSDGNYTEDADDNKRKRSREGTPISVEAEKTEIKAVLPPPADKVLGIPVTSANAVAGQVMGTVVSPGVATTLELRNPGVTVKGNSSPVSSPNGVVSSEAWLQTQPVQTQNERELKRERRKQSNRESARRSRLRKQAETEELARRVESLSAENMALKSEVNLLVENSQKLRLENAALTGKLKNLQSGQGDENGLANVDTKRNPSDSTENLLSRVNNSSSVGRNSDEGAEMFGKSAKSGAKFHQLLDNRRGDAVAAR